MVRFKICLVFQTKHGNIYSSKIQSFSHVNYDTNDGVLGQCPPYLTSCKIIPFKNSFLSKNITRLYTWQKLRLKIFGYNNAIGFYEWDLTKFNMVDYHVTIQCTLKKETNHN